MNALSIEHALEPIRRAFAAVGYPHEVLAKPSTAEDADELSVAGRIRTSAVGVDGRVADESGFRRSILENIRGRGRPVLAFGVIGPPPECCIITGADEDGETLMGWNFFQDKSETYFRERDWNENMHGRDATRLWSVPIGEVRALPDA